MYHVRNALILYVGDEITPEQIKKTIDSIRAQALIPWFIRIVFGGDDAVDRRFEESVDAAIDQLKLFCPNVVALLESQTSKREAINVALKQLSDKEYDVLINMDAHQAIEPDTFYYLTLPFLSEKMLVNVDGISQDVNYTPNWWDKFFVKKMAHRMIAYQVSFDHYQFMSATRKKTEPDNWESWGLPLMRDIRVEQTREPTLTIYY